MRRFLTKKGFSGSLGSLHKIEDDQEYEKAMIYVLKQQQPVFTDLPELYLKELMTRSVDYNQQIQKSKNIVMDVLENVVKLLKVATPDRKTIAKQIYLEYELINAKSDTWENYYCVPNGLQLLRMIQYVESKTTFNSYDRWFKDNERLICPGLWESEQITNKKASAYHSVWDDKDI